MKTLWPPEIVLRFKGSGVPVRNLVVHALIVTEHKNNFAIGPLLTNERGEVVLTREMMESTIRSSKMDYPMDYQGELSDCTAIEVIVDDKDALGERVDRLGKFYPKAAQALRELVPNSANYRYAGLVLRYDASACNRPLEMQLEEV